MRIMRYSFQRNHYLSCCNSWVHKRIPTAQCSIIVSTKFCNPLLNCALLSPSGWELDPDLQ